MDGWMNDQAESHLPQLHQRWNNLAWDRDQAQTLGELVDPVLQWLCILFSKIRENWFLDTSVYPCILWKVYNISHLNSAFVSKVSLAQGWPRFPPHLVTSFFIWSDSCKSDKSN